MVTGAKDAHCKIRVRPVLIGLKAGDRRCEPAYNRMPVYTADQRNKYEEEHQAAGETKHTFNPFERQRHD